MVLSNVLGKKKIQAELEDTNIELEAQRAKVMELEKKQKSFDKVWTSSATSFIVENLFIKLHENLSVY